MQVMILAGGYGTRISEESSIKPKPMVEIGEMPILWHIMKTYHAHGCSEFIVCCGYKGHVIKDWFANYAQRYDDITYDFDMRTSKTHSSSLEPWKVTLVDTGDGTMTGGRIKRAAKYLNDDTFCLTYGDGVGDVDVAASIEFHKSHGKKVTMTAIQPDQRFGMFSLSPDDNVVDGFREKPTGTGVWANAGYFVLDRSVLEYIDDDQTSWEVGPLPRLADEGEVVANRHVGFWMPMDTLRDKNVLEEHWNSGNPPWKIW